MIEHDQYPLVSVVIIGKNEHRTIERCVMSVFNQNYPNFEIIYVDDKSSDDTLQKAQQLKNILDSKKKCKRYMTVLADTDIPSKNRNIGTKISKGSVIAFIDADCIADRHWLANLIAKFLSGVGVVGGPTKLVHAKNSTTTKAIDLLLSSYLGSGGSAQFYKINEDRVVTALAGGNMAVRKELLDQIDGFDERLRYNEDSLLCFSIRKLGYRIVYAYRAAVYHIAGIDSCIQFNTYFKKYGYERGKNVARNFKLITTFNLISLVTIVMGLSLLMVSFFFSTALIIFLYLFIVILSIEVTEALKLVVSNKDKCHLLFIMILSLFVSLHCIYNIGFIIGYISGIKEAMVGKARLILFTGRRSIRS